MAEAAFRQGYTALGFSCHAHTSYESFTMSPDATEKYKADIHRLKAEYAGKMDILLGIEQDIFSDLPTVDYEYVIGSTHSLLIDGAYHAVDAPSITETVKTEFGGDWYALTQAYFMLHSTIIDVTSCDIVGHFDVVRRFNADDRYFDTANPRYRSAAIDALTETLKKCRVFEVNTGGMYKGGLEEQYPQTWLLRELLERGGEVILASDSHDIVSLGYKFADMEGLLRSVGFDHRLTLTPDGFAAVKL